MNRISKLAMVLLSASITLVACKQQPTSVNTQKFDAYFNAVQPRFMGSVMISKAGQIIYQRSVGYASIEDSIPATADTRYHIGSISKTFTAVMVLKAVEQGKISLSDHLSKYFPESGIANADVITIDHLLYHRSGIHDVFEGANDYMQWYDKPHTADQLVERIAQASSDFAPGSQFQYCNSGYVLLTFILEKVYGKSYAELLQEQITKPLNLKNTYYPTEHQATEARSYVFSSDWQSAGETHPSVPQGAGALVSTPADLTVFANALFDGFFGDSLLTQMTQTIDGFGRGMFVVKFYENQGFGHTGGIDGFVSVFFKVGDVVLTVCSNGISFSIDQMAVALLSIANGRQIDIPDYNYITLDSQRLEAFVGTYTCDALHMDIAITSTGTSLQGQATGQSAFPLDTRTDGVFECTKAGIVILIDDTTGILTLRQGGGEFKFVKK